MRRQRIAKPEDLYAATPLLTKPTKRKLGLLIPVTIYVQDPSTTKDNPKLGLKTIELEWEPGLKAGPTSARIAVVDYNADTGELIDPVRWDPEGWCFADPDGQPVEQGNPRKNFHFHQVNTWAVVQNVLAFFEHPTVLGRPVPWAFEGNRLIVVPHAGYGENAFYDRYSKSLQFYYCGTDDDPIYTCLSHDIAAHEIGHAILDGIRSYYYEDSSVQTMAFHEFVADLTAILTALRNNDIRREMAAEFGADLSKAKIIAGLAEEFSQYTEGRPHLRSALKDLKMKDIEGNQSPYDCSQVLTGAIYEILIEIAAKHMEKNKDPQREVKVSPAEALWWAADRIRRLAFQPLDLLPPVDVEFVDYARAVLRTYDYSNPQDPQGYREIIWDVFHDRGLCKRSKEECKPKSEICDLEKDDRPGRFHRCDIDYLSRSRMTAYHFLHENRGALSIPAHQDIAVVDLYDTDKTARAVRRRPREIVLEYVWREGVELDKPRFGSLRGQTVSLLCGGTLVFDDRGNLLSWFRKPGTQSFWTEEGQRRQKRLLDHVASRVEKGLICLADEGGTDRLEVKMPVVVGRRVDGRLRLEMTPHLRHPHLRHRSDE